MRKEVKKAQLDICGFDKHAAQIDSKLSAAETISRGSNLSVRQNGYDILITVLVSEKGRFIGEIVGFDASLDKYTDLAIGDMIEFKRENICSIP